MRSLAAIKGVEPELGLTSVHHHGGVTAEGDMAGAQDTIYLCNFRVSVDGEWLCLKELHDMDVMQDSYIRPETGVITSPDDPMHALMGKPLFMATYDSGRNLQGNKSILEALRF